MHYKTEIASAPQLPLELLRPNRAAIVPRAQSETGMFVDKRTRFYALRASRMGASGKTAGLGASGRGPVNSRRRDQPSDEVDVARWLFGVADPIRLAILRALSEVDSATMAEINCLTAASRPTLRRHLLAMVALGLISEEVGKSDGMTTGRPATRFSLQAAVADEMRKIFRANG